LTNVVDVDDGHYHSLALKSDGSVWGWGFNGLGQLAQGNDTNQVSPVEWGNFSNAVGVWGGRDMTYVLTDDGTLWCSGGTGLECGRPAQNEIREPVTVPGAPDVVDFAAGRNHAVALASDGTVWTWGDNSAGQLGDGTTTSSHTPAKVQGLSNVVDVGAGADHSLAVTASGDVYAWGWGARGQLGLGDLNSRKVPTKVPGLSNIDSVDAGRDTTYAVTDSGDVWSWGENSTRQTSNTTTDIVKSPFKVSGLSNVVEVSGGQAYSVALTAPAAPLLTDGFDSGLSQWHVVGALGVDNSTFPPTGTAPSVRADVTDGRAAAWRTLATPVDSACITASVNRGPIGTKTSLLRLRDTASSGIAQVLVAPNGALRVSDEVTGITAKVRTTLSANQWYRLTLCTQTGGGPDEVSLRLDGAPLRNWLWTTAPVGEVQIGSQRSTTATWNLDDVVVTGG
jgi:hypothetical protein